MLPLYGVQGQRGFACAGWWLQRLWPQDLERRSRKRQPIKYVVKDGIIYDAHKLLDDVEAMVPAQKGLASH
jgi:hypothetical protein